MLRGGAPITINYHFPPGTDVAAFRASQNQLTLRALQMANRARKVA